MPKNNIPRGSRNDPHSRLSKFNAAFLEHLKIKDAERRRRPASRERRHQELHVRRLAYNADGERREALGREGRIAEDGEAFLAAIKSKPDASLLLQLHRPPKLSNVWCRARDCLAANSDIHDTYRITVFLHGLNYPEYYHVSCMEALVPLAALVGSHFKLHNSIACGLLLGKWLEHRGRIKVDKIASYIDRVTNWSEICSQIAQAFDTVDLEHSIRCTEARPSCGCSERPKDPKVPVLKNYVTDETVCLSKVLSHPYVQRGKRFLDAYPPWRFDALENLESGSDDEAPIQETRTISTAYV